MGSEPFTVVTADINGDGKLDLIAANFLSNNLTVVLGNGSGGFTATTGSPVAAGTNPFGIVAADLNGDGKIDLAVSNAGSNNVTVLLGNGTGALTAVTGSPFSAGSNPLAMALGDFNGDGYPDLAVPNYNGNNVTLLLGNGTGAFTAAASGPLGVGANPRTAVAGDFNGDGALDLVITNYGSNTVAVLLGNLSQTIAFSALPNLVYGAPPFTVIATASSGLLVSFSSLTSTVCSVSGATVTLLAAGTCTIQATQAGNSTYGAAPPINGSFTVTQANTRTVLSITPQTPTPAYGATLTLAASVADNTTGSTGTPTGTAQFAFSLDNGNTWTSLGSPVTLASGAAQLQTTALPAGTPLVKISYSGDGNFSASTATVIQPVNRTTLTVTGITASNKSYDGTTAAALNTSGAMLAGVLSGDSVSLGGTALGAFIDPNAGNGKTVTITGLTLAGSAAANYTLTQPAATAGIAQIGASVTPNAASKTYGTADPPLSGTLTGFLAADNVTATYTRTTGSTAGTYTISASLNPPGALANYSIAPNTASFLIARATPVVTWAAPAAIAYGGALGNGQLAATVGVPGTFAYTPVAGAVLPIGTNEILSVTFTPADTVDYNAASASTTITVNATTTSGAPANLVITRILTRSDGTISVQLTAANNGGTAAGNVVITSVTVGGVKAAPLPQTMGTIAAGTSAITTVTIPGTVGASGAASSLVVAGTWTGGTLSSSSRITLP